MFYQKFVLFSFPTFRNSISSPSGNTALMRSAWDGHYEVCMLLVFSKADLAARSRCGRCQRCSRFSLKQSHRSLAAMATLPSNGPCRVRHFLPLFLDRPWTSIRATLLPFSAASGRRNDCTRQSYASRLNKRDGLTNGRREPDQIHDIIQFQRRAPRFISRQRLWKAFPSYENRGRVPQTQIVTMTTNRMEGVLFCRRWLRMQSHGC